MSTITAQKHVLVVDDNPGDIGLMRHVMEGFTGVAMHAVPNVLQAHAFLERVPPHANAPATDLTLLDLRMPMIPGYQLIPLVRGDAALQHLRIVVFSSSALEHDRDQCRGLGADDYVIKPCDWIHWRSLIAQVFARHGIILDDALPGPLVSR